MQADQSSGSTTSMMLGCVLGEDTANWSILLDDTHISKGIKTVFVSDDAVIVEFSDEVTISLDFGSENIDLIKEAALKPNHYASIFDAKSMMLKREESIDSPVINFTQSVGFK